ncbi:hypothetical protein HDU79_008814 [Rhizoclosmatium sp. JEL0117]|nr:hypothetical protein HDU79_008814 [Rhizoclosmatium sp. JEL0117]
MSSNDTSVSPLNGGDTAWIITSSVLVFVQIPALGFFYAGLVESKNSLSTLLSVLLCGSVVIFQWILFGYSLSFSDTSSSNFIGNFEYGVLRNSMDTQNLVATTIPNALLCMYQMMFAAITPGLLIGGVAGRLRLIPMMVFVFLWTTIVYDQIAYWNWSVSGWLHAMNVMDYAGGSVVHISSGVTGFVLAMMLGKRVDYGKKTYKPHNPTFVYLGTALIWFGWNGFNGGSAFASNQRSVAAAFATNIAAAMGGLTFMLMEKYVNKKGLSAVAYCNGVVIGLVAITPGSGFVQPIFAIFFGIIPAIACFYAMKVGHWLKVDDVLEVGASHGVGGAVGMLMTGIFAQYSITTLDAGPGVPAGWLDGQWMQVPVQLAGIASVTAWTAAWTVIIVYVMNMIPGLKLRCDEDAERVGLDIAEVGEAAYPYVPVMPEEDDVEAAAKIGPIESQVSLTTLANNSRA